MKRILIGTVAMIMAMPCFAEDTPATGDKRITSKPYVDNAIATRQDKIPAANLSNTNYGETVMTYTPNGDGEIGERALFTGGEYDASTDADKLITASALNTAFTTLPETPTTKLVCANQSDGCTLWNIVEQTAYGETITLPAGYTRLAYIESSGTQYIDTGIKLASTDVVNANFRNVIADEFGALYGVYQIGQSSAFYANHTYYGYNAENTKVDTNLVVDTNWHSVTHDFVNGKLIIDDTTVPFSVFAFNNDVNNHLFARYYNGSYGYYWKGAVKQYKITRNGDVILNLIPAKNSSNEIGMYDTVSRQFFRNDGTGTFTAGPEVN